MDEDVKGVSNCRYVERLDMGGVDIHIINPMGEAWVTSLDNGHSNS